MESLVLLVCSLLLLVALSNAQDLNCNLQNGAGCFANGPYFYMSYQFTHSGSSSQCRQAYNLRINTPSNAKGFECSFVTNGSPQPNTYRYTISENPNYYWASTSPHIRVYGNDALIKMAEGSGIYQNNFWYIPNMHASSGYSWANYRVETDYLSYYSSNTGVQSQSGHPYGFTPPSKSTYIGLNKRYGSNSFGGYGLCQVYCRIITQSLPPPPGGSRSGVQGAAGSTGENLSTPTPPNRPPAAPTGSGK